MDENSTKLWVTIQIREVMGGFTKHEIKCHPSITYIFVRFFITANIYEPTKEITQVKK